MIRAGGAAGAQDPEGPYYAVVTTPLHGLMVTWRNTEGDYTNTDIPGITIPNPVYLMATWYTDPVHNVVYEAAYYSTDNKNFTLIPDSVVELNLLNENDQLPTVGLVATAFNDILATTTFNNFANLGSAPAPPGICPAAWECEDIGGALPSGTQTQVGSTWIYTGSGTDIWSNFDQFHFTWQALPADGTATAYVSSVANALTWAKGGLMFRSATGDPDPAAPYYGIFAAPDNGTPSSGVVVQWRPTEGAQTNQIAILGPLPVYLELDRYTVGTGASAVTYYQALTSPDGTIWTAVPGSLMTIPALTGSLEAGVATDSWNQGTPATWTMSDVAVNPGVELAPPASARRPGHARILAGQFPPGVKA